MKKLIVCLLTMTVLLSVFTTSFAESTDSSNSQNIDYATDILKGLNIYNNSNSNYEKITRIEFIANLCEIIDSNNISSYNNDNVSDIIDVQEADKRYVELALKKGLIKKPSDKKFYPDKTVDLDFAAYAFVAMTGHFYDLQRGSYLNKADSLGITKGVNNFDALTYADFVIMLYNMLDSKYLMPVNNGIGEYEESDDTVLEHFFGLNKFNARLVSNSYTDLTNSINLTGNYIALQRTYDNVIETFECNYEYDTELLGRNVTAYYSENEETVVYMALRKNDECLVEINGINIINFDVQSRKLSYQKMKSGNRWEEKYVVDSVKIPINIDIIYNGQFTLEHSYVFEVLNGNEDLNVEKVCIYDIDGDSKADMLKVDAYDNVLVKTINHTEYTLYDSITGKRYEFDTNSIVKVEDLKGSTLDFSSIKSKDVASIYRGKGTQPLVRIVVSNNIKNEYIVSRYEKNNVWYVETENTKYPISKCLVNAGIGFSLGKEYKLYLDHVGYIVKVSELDTVYNNIGSVVKINETEQSSDKIELQIYTANGEFVTHQIAEKVYIDGEKVVIDNTTWTYVDKNGNEININQQLKKGIIQFNVNSNNEINKIYFPKKDGEPGIITYSSGMANPEEVFTDSEKYTLRFKTNGNYFIPHKSGTDVMNFVALSSDAKIMTVPSDNITSGRERYYKITESIKNDTEAAVVGYSFSKDALKSDIVVIISDGSASIENSAYYVVKSKYLSLNSDDMPALTLECMSGSGSITTFVGEDEIIPLCDTETGKIKDNDANVSVGDIIKVALNNSGELSAIGKAYDYVNKTGTLVNPTYWYTSNRFVYSSVYDIDDDAVAYVVGKEIADESSLNNSLQVVGLGKTSAVIVKQGRSIPTVEYGNISQVIGYKEDSSRYSTMILSGGHGEPSFVVFYLKE